MESQIKLSPDVQNLLCCPICRAELEHFDSQFACANFACNTYFPIINGIPVLLNEKASLFSIDDFTKQRQTTFTNLQDGYVKRFLKQLIPSISKNYNARDNYKRLTELLISHFTEPRVLVIGGGILGFGMESLASESTIELVDTDVSFGPRTRAIVDVHDIPFVNESFHGVVLQGVLNCVIDPHRCVDEIYRVLHPNGYLYLETPFMQQGCTGRFDFTRFTHLGIRRLLRRFAEIDSGVQGGPGMALAWFYKYFLLSFTQSKFLRNCLWTFAHFTSFFLKYFDYFLVNKPAAIDAASGFYFLAQKSDKVLPDNDLIKLYRGAS